MTKSVQQIKNRISGIEKTKKVTSAMQMISLSKLNRIEKLFYSFKPYFSKFESLMHNLINTQNPIPHPFLQTKTMPEKICLCVITSDSGLCGLYNNAVINKTEEFIKNYDWSHLETPRREQGLPSDRNNRISSEDIWTNSKDKISLVCVGKKGFNYFKKRPVEILNAHIGLNGRYSDKAVQEITDNLTGIFTSGIARHVYIAYTHCQTAFVHAPKIEKLLNIEQTTQEQKEYIFEPQIDGILEKIIPRYILLKLKLIILESFISEHAARAIAMKLSTDNARDLLDTLIMLKNKLRQANITQELLEIISSSEALKG